MRKHKQPVLEDVQYAGKDTDFFGLLKSELLYLQKFESVDHFREKLEAYLKYYNEDIIKLKLGGKSPVQYRLQHRVKAS